MRKTGSLQSCQICLNGSRVGGRQEILALLEIFLGFPLTLQAAGTVSMTVAFHRVREMGGRGQVGCVTRDTAILHPLIAGVFSCPHPSISLQL